MKPSPAPWEYENVSQCADRSGYAVVKDTSGKVLFDTINSDVACISTEHDEGSVTYTDEQGRVNLMLAAHTVNCHDELLALVADLWQWATGDPFEEMSEEGAASNGDALAALYRRVAKVKELSK